MKNKLRELSPKALNYSQFKEFYNFIFDYAKQKNSKYLGFFS